MIAMARAHVLRGQESGSLAQAGVASRSSPDSGIRCLQALSKQPVRSNGRPRVCRPSNGVASALGSQFASLPQSPTRRTLTRSESAPPDFSFSSDSAAVGAGSSTIVYVEAAGVPFRGVTGSASAQKRRAAEPRVTLSRSDESLQRAGKESRAS